MVDKESQSLSADEKRLLQETLRRYRNNDIPAEDDDHHHHDDDESSFASVSWSAALIFFGSMLGTLLGTFTSINDLYESMARLEDMVNPPVEVCVAGSNTLLGEGLGMADLWEAGYEEQTDRVNVRVNPTGSIDGVRLAAAGGCVHVLAMSEAMTPEQASLLDENNVEIQCAAEIGYDVIAFVTHNDNELAALEENLMGGILRGRYTNWDEVRGDSQPIYIYARPGSGTTDYVLKEFGWLLGERSFPQDANYFPCETNGDCLDRTLSTPRALYWVSTSWMKTQPPDYLRVLPILEGDDRPINPLVDDFAIGEYPNKLIRPLYCL